MKKNNVITSTDFDIYYKDISDSKSLSKEEETQLAKRIKEGDISARNELVEANLKFVVFVAKNYLSRWNCLSDLVEEGNLGLIRAAEKFDPSSGNKFISYAVFWIKAYIQRFIDRQTDITGELDGEEYNPHIVETHIDERYLNEVDEDDGMMMERTMDKNITVDELINVLTERERKVIEAYYGLHEQEEKSLNKIGKVMHLSTERVRQLLNSGMDKLRMSAMTRKDFQRIQQLGN